MTAYEFAKTFVHADDWVLDVGCSEGYGTAKLAEASNHVLGIDADETTIWNATAKHLLSDISFEQADALDTGLNDNMFDVVVCSQMVEHIKDDAGLIAELHRILKPGGKLVVVTPNRVYRLPPGSKPWNRFHVREYDSVGLLALMFTRFSNVDMFGIFGDEATTALEYARVRRLRQSKTLTAIRRAFPNGLLKLVRSVSEKRVANAEVGRYHVAPMHLNSSLDLVAVGVK